MFAFDGVDDKIQATISAVDTGDWTIAAWCVPNSLGEGSLGRVFCAATSGGTVIQMLRMVSSGGFDVFEAFQAGSTNTTARSNNCPATFGRPYCVCARYLASTQKIELWWGTLTEPMVQQVLTTDTTGNTRTTTGSVGIIGNNAGTSTSFDGQIGPIAFDNIYWTVANMENFRRTGRVPLSTELRAWYPLDDELAREISRRQLVTTVTGALLVPSLQLPGLPQMSRRLRSYVR